MLNERLGAGVSRQNRTMCSLPRAFVPRAHLHSPVFCRLSARPRVPARGPRRAACPRATPAGGPEESTGASEENLPDAPVPQSKLGSKASTDGPALSDMRQRRSRSKPTNLADETPLRDTNRDVMLGVLTQRACRTLIVYLQETNINVCHWLVTYMNKNPINLSTGNWQDVSGDTFLRGLLSMPIEEARFDSGCAPLHNNASSCDVDPRSIAQRILAIRAQLATELIQDMQQVSEDNSDLLQRCFRSSLENCLKTAAVEPVAVAKAGLRAEGCGAGADN